MNKIKVHEILAFIIMLWVLNPKANLFFNSFFLFVFFIIWVLFAFSFYKGLAKSELNLILVCALYPFIIFLYFLFGHSDFEKTPLFTPLMAIMYFYYSKKKDCFFRKNITKVVLVYLSAIYIYSIIKLHSNPNLARDIAGSDLTQATLLMGGYNTVYDSVLFDLAILWKLKYEKISSTYKKELVLFLTLSFLFLLKAQYTIALLLLVTGAALIIITNIKKKYFIYIVLIILTVTVLLHFIGLDNFFYFTADLIPQGIMHNRFIQLGDLFAQTRRNAENNGFDNRMLLYNNSFQSFKNNPLFGVGNYKKNTLLNLVGNHSSYFDALARYGLLGGGALIIGRIIYFKKTNNNYDNHYRKVLYSIQIIFYLLSILNTTHTNDFAFIMMVLIPFFVLDKKNKKNVYS